MPCTVEWAVADEDTIEITYDYYRPASPPQRRKAQLRIKVDDDLHKPDFSADWVLYESGLFPVAGDLRKHRDACRNGVPIRLAYNPLTQSIRISKLHLSRQGGETIATDSAESTPTSAAVHPPSPKDYMSSSEETDDHDEFIISDPPILASEDYMSSSREPEDSMSGSEEMDDQDAASPTLGLGTPNPLVQQTTAGMFGYGVPAPQAPPPVVPGNSRLSALSNFSDEALAEMELFAVAWVADIRWERNQRQNRQ